MDNWGLNNWGSANWECTAVYRTELWQCKRYCKTAWEDISSPFHRTEIKWERSEICWESTTSDALQPASRLVLTVGVFDFGGNSWDVSVISQRRVTLIIKAKWTLKDRASLACGFHLNASLHKTKKRPYTELRKCWRLEVEEEPWKKPWSCPVHSPF